MDDSACVQPRSGGGSVNPPPCPERSKADTIMAGRHDGDARRATRAACPATEMGAAGMGRRWRERGAKRNYTFFKIVVDKRTKLCYSIAKLNDGQPTDRGKADGVHGDRRDASPAQHTPDSQQHIPVPSADATRNRRGSHGRAHHRPPNLDKCTGHSRPPSCVSTARRIARRVSVSAYLRKRSSRDPML